MGETSEAGRTSARQPAECLLDNKVTMTAG